MADDQSGQQRPTSATSDFNVIDTIVRRIAGQMQTATLVLVKAVGTGTVDVQPMVAQIDGKGNATPHGVIHGLPVWRLQGGNGAVILTPAVGDIGLAIFAREDISSVKVNKAPANPGSRRTYAYSDGIYLGGVLNAPPSTYVKIDTGGTVEIVAPTSVTITSPNVTIAASGGVTINSPMTTFSGDIQTAAGSTFNGKSFDSHTHGGVQTGSGTSGPPS